ncbi:BQ5605_C015g07796 [Microbotryum silenes-dioicae]|uniref:BQ5605_C015g07796 protein n=1 Tax=Microbotryum silenes-dioicae TaxID=796604 RepID=A0A2X0NX92_9BASI|nr:BQ5605_C015g07796 [Microbotryum silenes-dioicae]
MRSFKTELQVDHRGSEGCRVGRRTRRETYLPWSSVGELGNTIQVATDGRHEWAILWMADET